MNKKRLDIEQTRVHLALALEVVQNDRWLLGGVRDGRLRVLADAGFERASPVESAPEAAAPAAPVRPIYQKMSHLARRCLYEGHPVAVSSMVSIEFGDDAEWELDWPSIVYAPVGLPESRPVGILIVASKEEHWYTQDEIDYVAALAVTMTAAVAAACGPLGRLAGREREVALLLAENLADEEIAVALRIAVPAVRRLVDRVLGRLELRSRREVRDLVPGLTSSPGKPRLLM